MKNLLFSLIAIVFMGTSVYGQQKKLKDHGKAGVEVYNYAFQKAKQFENKNAQKEEIYLDGLQNAKPELIQFLKVKSDLDTFTGYEFLNFAKIVIEYSELKKGKPDFDSEDFKEYLLGKDYKDILGDSLYGKGFWGSLWDAIKSAAEWILDNIEYIKGVLTMLSNI